MLSTGKVFALGTRLRTLSIENGKTSLMPTSAHIMQWINLGAFLKTRRRITTAKTSQLAVMLIFTSLRKISLIFFPPHTL